MAAVGWTMGRVAPRGRSQRAPAASRRLSSLHSGLLLPQLPQLSGQLPHPPQQPQAAAVSTRSLRSARESTHRQQRSQDSQQQQQQQQRASQEHVSRSGLRRHDPTAATTATSTTASAPISSQPARALPCTRTATRLRRTQRVRGDGHTDCSRRPPLSCQAMEAANRRQSHIRADASALLDAV